MPAAVETISVNCNHCGAPLRVANRTRFATCTYCKSSLEIHVNGGAAYTEVLERIDARTEQIAQGVEELKLREKLVQLDREWGMAQQRYHAQGIDGSVGIPGVLTAIVGGILVLAFLVFWTWMAASHEAPIFFPLFGIAAMILVVGRTIFNLYMAKNYGQA